MRPSSFSPSPVGLGLAALVLQACSGFTEYFPFHPSGEVTDPQAPAVRYEAHLRGVVQVPAEGPPSRRYELTIELAPGDGVWEPVELANTAVQDDEGNVFRAGEVLVAEASRSGARRYRVVYPLRRPYRFQSIGRTSVVWRLRAPGQPPVSVESSFRQ